jgi:hypothetical protein
MVEIPFAKKDGTYVMTHVPDEIYDIDSRNYNGELISREEFKKVQDYIYEIVDNKEDRKYDIGTLLWAMYAVKDYRRKEND